MRCVLALLLVSGGVYSATGQPTITGLPNLPDGRPPFYPLGVNGDGTIVVGAASLTTGEDRAVLWTESLGIVDLQTYLPTVGVDLSGWTLLAAYGISADGTAIIGVGNRDTSGSKVDAWLVKGLPPLTSPPACGDANGDGVVNFADITAVLTHWGMMCP